MTTVSLACLAEECDRAPQTRGYCPKHYQRVRKYGDPSVVHRPQGRGPAHPDAPLVMRWSERLCPATPDNSEPCIICGEPVFIHRTSARGRMAHRACRQAARGPKPTSCEECGEAFASKQRGDGWTRFCSKACSARAAFKAGTSPLKIRPVPDFERSPAARATASLRRRRRRLAEVPRDPYTKDSIAERDGYVCGLCGRSVDMSLKYPDRMSASIDHILPISKGGDDTLVNVQLAHLRCNLIKGGDPDGRTETAGRLT